VAHGSGQVHQRTLAHGDAENSSVCQERRGNERGVQGRSCGLRLLRLGVEYLCLQRSGVGEANDEDLAIRQPDGIICRNLSCADRSDVAGCGVKQIDLGTVCQRSILESRSGIEGGLSAAKAATDGIDLRLADIRRSESDVAKRLLASRRAVDTWKNGESQLLAAFPSSGDLDGVIRVAGSEARSLLDLKSKLVGIQGQAKSLVDQGDLAAARAMELRLRNERAPLVEEEQRLKAAMSTLERLTRDAKAAEIEIVQGVIAAQMPVLRALYQRLNPHPLFDGLDVTYGNFDGKGEVYYRARRGDTTGNVSMMFSSAQLNAVGVCIFLSLSLMRPAGGVSWVLLDDPIQNMDDYNILGLVDLLRSFRGQRQVIVSTHDDQIGELLRRKLRPQRPEERTAVHRFLSIDEEGPRIVSTVDQFAAQPFVLEAATAS
jgi:hypothetical protein